MRYGVAMAVDASSSVIGSVRQPPAYLSHHAAFCSEAASEVRFLKLWSNGLPICGGVAFQFVEVWLYELLSTICSLE
eukprot:364249-Chlamydomonas_euryale.AAC.3